MIYGNGVRAAQEKCLRIGKPTFDVNSECAVLEAVSRDGCLLGAVPEPMKSKRDIVLAAVRDDGYALLLAPYHFVADEEIVKAAVSSKRYGYPNVLYYLPQWCDHDSVVRAAVARDGPAIAFASARLRDDKNIALTMQAGGSRFLSNRLRADRDVAMHLVTHDHFGLAYLSNDLRADREIVRAAIGKTCSALGYADDALRLDPEMRLRACTSHDVRICFVRAAQAVDDALAEMDVDRAQDLADAAAVVCERFPRYRKRAEAITAKVFHPKGLVVETVFKRSYERALGSS